MTSCSIRKKTRPWASNAKHSFGRRWQYGDEFDDEGDYMELDGPPPEVLDGWEKDDIAMALLAQFQSEEFEGKAKRLFFPSLYHYLYN